MSRKTFILTSIVIICTTALSVWLMGYLSDSSVSISNLSTENSVGVESYAKVDEGKLYLSLWPETAEFIEILPQRDLTITNLALANKVDIEKLQTQRGNAVIIGHRNSGLLRDGVFANLPDLEVNDRIAIREQGGTRTYKIIRSETVDDEEISIEADTVDHQITIYTCSGIFAQKRFVVVAIPDI